MFDLFSCISQFQQCETPPPPPPRANPRTLAFFTKLWANSPGWEHISCLNALGWGQMRANVLPPGSSPSNTSAVFLLISE